MRQHHPFLLGPGAWSGIGKLRISLASEEIEFRADWQVPTEAEGAILAVQRVHMDSAGQTVINTLRVFDISDDRFSIELKNDAVGAVTGRGFIDADKISWEFRQRDVLEGFEIYHRKPDGSYIMHAEYMSPDQYRTVVDGTIQVKP